jgi:hypothetical protein
VEVREEVKEEEETVAVKEEEETVVVKEEDVKEAEMVAKEEGQDLFCNYNTLLGKFY